MPTIEELQALYQHRKGSRNMDPVFVTTGWWVWIFETDGSSARYFSFYYGGDLSPDRNSSYDGRVFAVRARRS